MKSKNKRTPDAGTSDVLKAGITTRSYPLSFYTNGGVL